MTTLAQEVDARFMELYNGATIEDLERGLKTAMREANHIRYGMFSREEDKEWLHHAALLRAEIARRQAVLAVIAGTS